MSLAEVDDFLVYREREAKTPDESDAPQTLDAPLGPELTVEQYEALVASMKANAAQYGTRKPNGW